MTTIVSILHNRCPIVDKAAEYIILLQHNRDCSYCNVIVYCINFAWCNDEIATVPLQSLLCNETIIIAASGVISPKL